MCFGFQQTFILDRTSPLLCAGITLYSPLVHWRAGPGKKVGIIGLGGLGHIGVKIAHALGSEVTVFSHSRAKEIDATRMGADRFYATSEQGTLENLKGYFDLLINTVSSPTDLNSYLEMLALDGTMVLVGIPERRFLWGLLAHRGKAQPCRLAHRGE